MLAACSQAPPPALEPSETVTSTASSAASPAATPATEAAVTPSERRGALKDVAVELAPVARLDEPIALAVRPGDDALYIAERSGFVRVVRDGEVDRSPLLDISGEISTGGERGLLGIAFSQDGDELYVSYTNDSGDSRVDAYPFDNGALDVADRRELLGVEQPFPNHNGGNVVVGRDGMLYVGLGDGGAGGDPHANGQDPGTLLGKMLRLDPADGAAPPDNPFVDRDEVRPEIFALGLRNPWRFSFDRQTGDLWIGDVGQNSIEEVSVTRAGQSAGRNFGWNVFEGSQPYKGNKPPPGNVFPVIEYPTGEQGCAVTGGYVYRGSAIPELRGAYLYSDYCGGFVRAARVEGTKVTDEADLGLPVEQVASFGEDGEGELYVLSLDGRVDKIVPARN